MVGGAGGVGGDGAVTGGAVGGGAAVTAGAGGAVLALCCWGITELAVDGGAVGAVVETGGAELVVVDGAGDPDAGTTDQTPATPCPTVSPAFLSPLKRYSGMPSKVTWREPSDRLTVASADEVTPGPPLTCDVATVNGGHVAAHAPVHVGLPVPSGEYRYRVNPDRSTKIVPSAPAGAVDTTAVVVRELAVFGFRTGEVGDEALELHAVATTATRASDPITVHSRTDRATGRFGWSVGSAKRMLVVFLPSSPVRRSGTSVDPVLRPSVATGLQGYDLAEPPRSART